VNKYSYLVGKTYLEINTLIGIQKCFLIVNTKDVYGQYPHNAYDFYSQDKRLFSLNAVGLNAVGTLFYYFSPDVDKDKSISYPPVLYFKWDYPLPCTQNAPPFHMDKFVCIYAAEGSAGRAPNSKFSKTYNMKHQGRPPC